MKYVYVLEREEKFQKEIFEALQKIDSKLKIRFFPELENFATWINSLIKEGKESLHRGGFALKPEGEVASGEDVSLPLIICSNDILGSRSMGLLKKTHELFVRKGLCTHEEPTSVVITAFDNPEFDIRWVEDRLIQNVIYKPFDPLILQQHLNFAVSGRHPPTENNLHNMKTSSTVEMTKDAKMEMISTVGFVTSSERAVEVGAISKYYSEFFTSGKTRSVMARCQRCEPHPREPGQFLVTLTYFGLETEQLKNLRKSLARLKPESKVPSAWAATSAMLRNAVVLDLAKEKEIEGALKRNFPVATVVNYNSWSEFEIDADPTRDPSLSQKSLPVDTVFKVLFDLQGKHPLSCEPELQPGQKVFGLAWEEFKKQDFHSLVYGPSQNIWKGVVSNNPSAVGLSPLFTLDIQQQKKIVRVASYKKAQTKNGTEAIEVFFQDVPIQEKLSYLKSLSRWPAQVDLMVLSIQSYKKLLEIEFKIQFPCVIINDQALTDVERKSLGLPVIDIFNSGYDKNFFALKLKAYFGKTAPEELETFKQELVIQIANPVEITEISEAGLILKYHRAMDLGSFRNFILWTPKETELKSYIGNCNYIQEVEGESPHFLNHFVFFGMKDEYLKNIRLWVRENYIQAKEKAG